MAEITCLVNNTALGGTNLLGEHGLAFWIETGYGSVLYDSGKTASVLAHNLEQLHLDPADASTLVLSHAHYDHTGGLEAIFARNTALNIHAHPGIFEPRYSLHNGEYKSIGLALSHESLENNGQLFLSDQPVEILPGLWTTGEITQRPEAEGRSTHHYIRTGENWLPDPYRDDQSLVLKTGQGLVVICGCCHAGLLNTLFHVRRMFDDPVIAVIGGTHLVFANEEDMEHVIEILGGQFPNLQYYLNHCTGERASNALVQVFGERVRICPAGTVINF